MKICSSLALSVLSFVLSIPAISWAQEVPFPLVQSLDTSSVSITLDPIAEVLQQAQWGTLQYIAPQVHPVDLLSDEEVQKELRALHQIADILRIPINRRSPNDPNPLVREFPKNPNQEMSLQPLGSVGSAVVSSLPPGEYSVPLGRADLKYLAEVVSQTLFTANQGDPLIGLSAAQRLLMQEEIDKILLSVPSMARRYNDMKRVQEFYRNRPNW